MKKYLYLLPCVALFSCAPRYYAPNAVNVPVFKGADELSFSGLVSGGGVQADAAYSVTDNFFAQGAATFYKPESDAYSNKGEATLMEIGLGYFKQLQGNFSWGASGTVGFGNISLKYPPTGKLDAKGMRFAGQPYIAYKNNWFEGVFSTRLSQVNYKDITGQVLYDGVEQTDYLRANASQFFIEPAITVRVGYKHLHLQLQNVGCFDVTDPDFRYDKNTFTVGFHFKFAFGKGKEEK